MNKQKSSVVSEPSIEMLGGMATQIVESRETMTQAFEDEIAIKARVLTQVVEAVKHCLPVIASRILGVPTQAIELLKRRDEVLYISEDGYFFTIDAEGMDVVSIDGVMRERWDLRELVLALTEEMTANLNGQLRKVENVQRTTRRLGAVAELLGA